MLGVGGLTNRIVRHFADGGGAVAAWHDSQWPTHVDVVLPVVAPVRQIHGLPVPASLGQTVGKTEQASRGQRSSDRELHSKAASQLWSIWQDNHYCYYYRTSAQVCVHWSSDPFSCANIGMRPVCFRGTQSNYVQSGTFQVSLACLAQLKQANKVQCDL